MTDIHIMGLPKSIKKPRLIHLLRTVIFGKKLRSKFWIRDAFPLPNSKFQQVVLNFSKGNDAYKATDLINDFVYFNGSEDFQLSAVIVDDHLSPEQYDDPMLDEMYEEKHTIRERESRQSGRHKTSMSRNKERSRSPHYKHESSKLDMEIELVRKQRLLVEEERKLLLEKKKLELLKEFGSSTVKEFEKYAAAVENNTLEVSESLKPQITVLKKNKPRQIKEGLPLFVLPCRLIIKGMKDIIIKHISADDNAEFKKALRMTIRKRIAEMLQNKKFMTSGEIVQLYRDTYPADTDEKLMIQLAAELKENVHVADEKQKATENSDNSQDKTEAKFLPGKSNSTNIEKKETEVEMENKLSEEKVNSDSKEEPVKDEVKKEVNANAGTTDLNAKTMSEEERVKDADIKVTFDDMYTELDDWLEDETNIDQENTNNDPGDNNTKTQDKDDDDLKQIDSALKEIQEEKPAVKGEKTDS